ncbi:EpsG family protein [Yersinia ruckeri]|uniref:EpsG family protein n=1 Tax=Yersinia ruckeri TaxID=29486 RepID=UPI0022352475|nr:EpsG family protein [Yersinia ruckeri]UIN01631.1 EpsG family protein [Yersinia ruckeri]
MHIYSIGYICGLRSEGVDRDYKGYVEIFNSIPNFTELFSSDLSHIHGDPLFFIISSMIKSFNLDVYLLFVSFSLLSILIYSWCFSRFSVYPFLSLFIYYCHGFITKEMTQIRAGLASALILLALCILSKRKTVFGTLIITFSFLAHSSSLPAYLFIFYDKVMKDNKRILFIIILSLIFFYLWMPLFSNLPSDFSITAQISNYMKINEFNYALTLYNPVFLRRVFYILILFYVRSKYEWKKSLDVFLFSYLLSICWWLIFSDMAILAARISNALAVPELILIPYAIRLFFLNNRPVIASLIFILTIGMSLAMLYSNLDIQNYLNEYDTINIVS